MRARPSFAAAVTRWLGDADRDRFDVPRDETRQKLHEILGG
jgi:hypothetical protein